MPDEIRILHVDDDPSHLQVVKLILERADPHIHVESAGDPHDALRRIAEAPVDCVVTDYMMPDINGIQLATRIRQSTDAPIILYTGQGSEEIAEEAFTVGVDDYIRKEPEAGHYQVLARRIRAAVEKHRAEAELRASEENYRNVIERANFGVIVTQDGLLRFANRRMTEMTGYPQEEVVGTPFIDYLHPDDRTEALEAYRNRDISEDTYFPFRVITRGGETRWIEINGVIIDWGGREATLHFI
ncbi:response regulator, partial [Candidatus Bathyarchaeota archaeon]